MAPIHSRYLPWMLAALTALFVLRVLAQAVQWVGPVPFLPSFDAWQGSALPYPLLLATQVAIIALLVRVLFLVRADAVRPASWKHNACFILGGAYFAVMAIRLVAGLTFLSDVRVVRKQPARPLPRRPRDLRAPARPLPLPSWATAPAEIREHQRATDTVLVNIPIGCLIPTTESGMRSQLERSMALRQGESW